MGGLESTVKKGLRVSGQVGHNVCAVQSAEAEGTKWGRGSWAILMILTLCRGQMEAMKAS